MVTYTISDHVEPLHQAFEVVGVKDGLRFGREIEFCLVPIILQKAKHRGVGRHISLLRRNTLKIHYRRAR